MIKRWNSGSSFEIVGGYDRVLRVGDLIFVAGTTGFDYSRMVISGDFEEQVNKALQNLDVALSNVGSSRTEVVRIRWIIKESEFFNIAGGIINDFFGATRPPATTIVADLVDERMLFEIEATAVAANKV